MWFRNDDTHEEMERWEQAREAKTTHPDEYKSSSEDHWDKDDDASVMDSDEEESEGSIELAKRSGATMQELYEATTPEEFYQLGVERNWTLPVQVLETYQRRLKSMQFRTGTIGAWLKDMLR